MAHRAMRSRKVLIVKRRQRALLCRRHQQARELLAPVYGWFTEGFDTRDPGGDVAVVALDCLFEKSATRVLPANNLNG
jgi:hypothetical protein